MSRMSKTQSEAKRSVVQSLKSNKYLGKETFEQFVAKTDQFRPGKKILYEKAPNREDKRELLFQYLREVRDREVAKKDNRARTVDSEKAEIHQVNKMLEDDRVNERKTKLQAIEMNRRNIALINAERQQVLQDEANFDRKVQAFGHFPYTHGDSIEVKRKEIKDQMKTHYNEHLQRNHS